MMIDTVRPTSKLRSLSLSERPSLLRIHRFSQTRITEVPASTALLQANASLQASEDVPLDVELAKCILSRIESRLPGRIRHLTVYTTENAVVLTGQCCTFYTKQLAQHIAMGVLEYEQLINNIDVRVAK